MANDLNILNYLEAGIKAEGSRQKLIANNVANMNTPGYRRTDIRFEEILAKAIETKGKIDMSGFKPEIYQPKTTSLKSNGNDVHLETEVGSMVKNSLKHSTYIKLLKKKYEQMKASMSVR